MTRLSGIRLLALSIALWALAVWLFGAPRPAEIESTAATTSRTAGERDVDSGTVAGDAARAETTTVSASGMPADQGGTTLPNPDTRVGSPSAQAASERTGIGTDSATSPGRVPEPSAAGTRTPTAASGDGSRIALAPAHTAGDRTNVPDATGAESVTGSPATLERSVPDGAAGIAGRPGLPPAPGQPNPWLDQPPSRPPPSARSGFPAADGNAVDAQLNAARRAAWEGRFTDALAHYRAAARLRPNDYVVWGEMGNVLWTLQRWSEAAYALEGAATLLVRAGELRAASELVPAVGRLDRQAAYRVQRLLWAAAQRQSG